MFQRGNTCKEITESWAMLEAVHKHLTLPRLRSTRRRRVLLLAVQIIKPMKYITLKIVITAAALTVSSCCRPPNITAPALPLPALNSEQRQVEFFRGLEEANRCMSMDTSFRSLK